MKAENKPVGPTSRTANLIGPNLRTLLLAALPLFVILSILFYKSYDRQYAHFSNDGPLGAEMAEYIRLPATWNGVWDDLNWLGSEGLTPAPSVTTILRLITTPFMYARILPPFSLFFAGLCAFFCFRWLGLSSTACVLGSLAAGLSSDFLSTTCWGVSSQVVGFGANYLAIGLISDLRKKGHWLRLVLAGMAVGIGIMEAYDIGALFSLVVAAYVFYRQIFVAEGTVPARLGLGVSKIAIVAICAAFISCSALTTLIGTQLKGMAQAETQQTQEEKNAVWDYDTAWSLPKKELLQVVIPGVFGYRQVWHMYENDQPGEDQYWGSIGAAPGLPRLSGTGYYAGVLVLLASIWAFASSLRGGNSPFTVPQRRLIWFWSAVLLFSALLAFGKFGFLYRAFFMLPYASAIRNPTKFMHVFSWAIVILFAYGIHGIDLSFLRKQAKRAVGAVSQRAGWWASASQFEKRWVFCSFGTVALSLLGWMIYFANEGNLKNYLGSPDIAIDPGAVSAVASYSVRSVGWFVFLLLVAVILLTVIFSGRFAGSRARWGGILLGAFLIADLATAGAPWIVYWNVPYKYASDPIMKFFAEKPYEHRVSVFPPGAIPQQLPRQILEQIAEPYSIMSQAYGSHWKQQIFPYYNIQCADIIQEPRVAEDKIIFSRAVPNLIRFWELSNTRYLLGPGHDVAAMIDPAGTTFRTVTNFNLVRKPSSSSDSPVDYYAKPETNGHLAVIEFVPAFKRAQLFSHWQIVTNDSQCLQALGDMNFDVHQTVLLANADAPAPAANPVPNQSAGTVEINPNYRPKRIELDADVKAPSVLVLSERYNPKWQVWVDGKPAETLKCDYILRGVYLPPGKHNVVFKFVTPLGTLFVSLSAVLIGVALSLFLAFSKDDEAAAPVSAEDQKPAEKPVAAKA